MKFLEIFSCRLLIHVPFRTVFFPLTHYNILATTVTILSGTEDIIYLRNLQTASQAKMCF
jgi:hypothetical protein